MNTQLRKIEKVAVMPKKILLVDDDVDLVESIAQALSFHGFEIATAYSGKDGLKELLEFEPDLIVLDVMMENDTAGFEVASQIRNKRTQSRYSKFSDVPIILLTAINQVTNSRFSLNEAQSFLPDINDFITKPFKIDNLIDRINAILEGR